MTTASWSSVVDHTGDVAFRAWGSEVSTQLAAVGLVQTADSGQINWGSVTRPGTNGVGGYEIWRFADSTIFLKFEYATGGGATTPEMWITAGSGSDGSGALTGQLSTRNVFTGAQAATSTATSYTSRMCAVADAFSFSWKQGATNSGAGNLGLLVIGKTVDGTGAATATGFGVLRLDAINASAALSFQSVRLVSTAATFTDTDKCALFPGLPSSSTTAGGATQAYTLWLNVPDVVPFCWAALTINAEAPRDTTFSVAMVGAAAHTFVSVGRPWGGGGINGYTAATYGVSMIYE